MLVSGAEQLTNKERNIKIVLTDMQQKDLRKVLKCGIYKELHKRGILSDAQLNSLLEENS